MRFFDPGLKNARLTSLGTLPIFACNAEVVELVDTRDLKSLGRFARTGSSPVLGTLQSSLAIRRAYFFIGQQSAPPITPNRLLIA